MTMKPVYERNPLLGNTNKFCPGCGHSLVNKIIADVLVENDWTKKAIEALCIGILYKVHMDAPQQLLQE